MRLLLTDVTMLASPDLIYIANSSILLIDDDKIQHQIITRLLLSAFPGFDIHYAMNGAEGFDVLLETKPGFVFLDINMPVMNGFEFLEKVEALDLELPIFMLSSSINHTDKKRSFSFKNVLDYYVKPFRPNDIHTLSKKIVVETN